MRDRALAQVLEVVTENLDLEKDQALGLVKTKVRALAPVAAVVKTAAADQSRDQVKVKGKEKVLIQMKVLMTTAVAMALIMHSITSHQHTNRSCQT